VIVLIACAITPVFVGDILNTAARFEEYAKRTGLDLLAPGELLGRLALPPDVETTRCGALALRVAADGLTGAPT
jgi:hypothetical protein